MSLLWKIPLTLLAVIVVVIAVALFMLGRKDGPTGPVPGGELTSGEWITTATPDWTSLFEKGGIGEVELQLVSTNSSRITGAFVHDNALYIPCDLGFVWRRMPDFQLRMVLRTLWFFKTWHKDAEADGRVVVRINSQRYPLQATRVGDPELEALFRQRVLNAASEYFGGLATVETSPEDIWFFRLDPRVDQSVLTSSQ